MIRLINGSHTGPINIGNPREFTIRQLAERMSACINPELPLIEKPLPAGHPRQRQPMINLARGELAWQRHQEGQREIKRLQQELRRMEKALMTLRLRSPETC